MPAIDLLEQIVEKNESDTRFMGSFTDLFGIDINETKRIEIGRGMLEVVNQENLRGRHHVPFDSLVDVFPPLTSQNLFVEFNRESAAYTGASWDRFGLHFVNWEICKKSKTFPALLKEIGVASDAEEVYAVALYFETESGVSFLQVGGLIGLDRNGSVASLENFWMGHGPLKDFRLQWDRKKKQMAWFLYLTLSTFSKINGGKFPLRSMGPMKWTI